MSYSTCGLKQLDVELHVKDDRDTQSDSPDIEVINYARPVANVWCSHNFGTQYLQFNAQQTQSFNGLLDYKWEVEVRANNTEVTNFTYPFGVSYPTLLSTTLTGGQSVDLGVVTPGTEDTLPAINFNDPGRYEVTYTLTVRDAGGVESAPTSATCVIANPGVQVNMQVWMNGPLVLGSGQQSTLMKDSLRELGVIPTVEPYTGLGYTHVLGGGEVVQPAVLSRKGNKAVVDWVFLELRSELDPTNVVATRSALILRDGSVVDVDGGSPVVFQIVAGNYYVAIKHRNHLGVMTELPQSLNVSLPTNINFKSRNTRTYRVENVQGSPSTFFDARSFIREVPALHMGNTQDVSDRDVILAGSESDVNPISLKVFTDPGNTGFSPSYPVGPGYYPEDCNMDGYVILAGSESDVNNVSLEVLLHPYNGTSSSTFIIREQIPT